MRCATSFGAMALVLAASCAMAAEVEVDAKAPDFSVTGTDGKTYNLESFKDADVIVVAFTCNSCPVAVAYEDRFVEFGKNKGEKVAFIAINSNGQSEDLPKMQQRAEEKGFTFPYAFDESGAAAKAYDARVTPHLFIINKDRKVAYRGSFDDKQDEPTKSYVADAVTALLAGKAPATTETKAFGCGIKTN